MDDLTTANKNGGAGTEDGPNTGRDERTNTTATITVFTKDFGKLTKKISPEGDGYKSNSEDCLMWSGSARRVLLNGIADLSTVIKHLKDDEAIGLGSIHRDQPDKVKIVIEKKINEKTRRGTISRSQEFLVYERRPTALLIDFDLKYILPEIDERVRTKGLWETLCEVFPPLRGVARIERKSTSSGLSLNGKALKGSDGLHIYIFVKDGTDIVRFLEALFKRCWLHGYGWIMLAENGNELPRTIVDKTVGDPSRMVFEAPPILLGGITQTGREPVVIDGPIAMLDTRACLSLNADEEQRYKQLVDDAKQAINPEAIKVREAWIEKRAKEMVEHKPDLTMAAAREQLRVQCQTKVLLTNIVLHFDAADLASCTVGDVLDDPERFMYRKLADPVDGLRGKAIVLPYYQGGFPFIHSLAHGASTKYWLGSPPPDSDEPPEGFFDLLPIEAYEDGLGGLPPPPKSQTLGVWDAGDDVEKPPPRGWLLGVVFARMYISSLLGDGGVGKTALRILQALSLATGKELTGEHVFMRSRVLILCLEDNADELRRRVLAARLRYNISAADVKGWLFLWAPGLTAGKLLEIDDEGKRVEGELGGKIAALIIKHKIDLVIVDPMVKSHAVDENTNNAIDAVVQILSDLSIRYDMAIDVPHHTRKGTPEPGNADQGRGATAMKDAARLVYTLMPMSEDEAKAFGIDVTRRKSYVRMDSGKVNIAPPMFDATWFHLIGVALGNATDLYPSGDNVQTMERWYPTMAGSDFTDDLKDKIIAEIDAGLPDGGRYTNAAAATGRAAWTVVAKHVPGKTREQGRQIIIALIDGGLLEVHEYEDPSSRKTAKGLRKGRRKNPKNDQEELPY